MSFHTGYVFFCSAVDYPKFLPFLKNDSPVVYSEFVRLVDQYIEQSNEQITVLKAECSFPDYIAFCKAKGHQPEHRSLDLFAQHIWASLPNA